MSQDARSDEEQATLRRARILGMSYVDTSGPTNKQIFRDVLSLSDLYKMRVIPLEVDQSNVLFGVTTTTSQQTMNQLVAHFTDQKIVFALISDNGFKDYMRLYDPPKEVKYADINLAAQASSGLIESVSATLESVRADDILAYLVKQAYGLKASDVHLENQKNDVRIRFRVDGVLHPIANLSREKFLQLLSTIAIAANIMSDSPDAQTGHINKVYRMATGEDVTVNLRVETVPAAFGQDVVMRLFNIQMELINLDSLGLSEKERGVVDDIINHPTGMALIVGPTGSGKTTTLYSLINTLRSDERKIITLEDPIEYYLDGIVQIPVAGDQKVAGFAEKLRAVLRLDPDIVMVGEIRDQDTAKTSLQAALTGHLVLSTFHASSAAAALTRMLDFIGINPLFASAIHLIMAQRLVRRLDDTTKEAYQPDEALRSQLASVLDGMPSGVERPDLNNVTLYRAGKSDSNPFGYSGQLAIREQLQMTQGVQQILKLPPNQVTTDMLEQKAIEDGMVTMMQDGVLKALTGVTSLEEVYRVVY
jgi:type II secretory ATPase GspE/PulE/Tfp pilus assembly ATPase PilB-like protein